MTDLDKLISAVEAGTHAEDIHWRVYAAAVGVQLWDKAKASANGSLDAAYALHKAVLPEWALAFNYWPGVGAGAVLTETHEKNGGRWHGGKDLVARAKSDTPARAWLLAILRAMKERGDA